VVVGAMGGLAIVFWAGIAAIYGLERWSGLVKTRRAVELSVKQSYITTSIFM
jgi:hypothetical protein